MVTLTRRQSHLPPKTQNFVTQTDLEHSIRTVCHLSYRLDLVFETYYFQFNTLAHDEA